MTKFKYFPSQEHGSLQLKDIDYIEFYVGNAYQATHFYRTAFGFTPIAYTGLEKGVRDQVSFVVEQGNIRLVLTTALSPNSPIADHVNLHGDGVKDIAFAVDNATHVFEEATKRGACPIMEPTVFEDQEGQVIKATIAAYGDTVHSFIQRDAYDGVFFPNYQAVQNPLSPVFAGLSAIDHITISVERGKLDQWVDFYSQALSFQQSHQVDISTEYSGMHSKVVQNSTGRIKFLIAETAPHKRKSQIEEYLMFYRGPGVQHIALLSDDIVRTVKALRTNGIEFLCIPDTYYDMLEDRIGKIEADIAVLRELNILIDRDEWGYLMQNFTRPVQSRPTFFWEVVQRQGARSFGSGNIKALFEAVEREQAWRGNV